MGQPAAVVINTTLLDVIDVTSCRISYNMSRKIMVLEVVEVQVSNRIVDSIPIRCRLNQQI